MNYAPSLSSSQYPANISMTNCTGMAPSTKRKREIPSVERERPKTNEKSPVIHSEKMAPLVESVNALPIETFIDRYVPSHILDSTITVPRSHIKNSENKTSSASDHQETDDYSYRIYSSTSIPEPDFEACFSLVKLTSSEVYKKSASGWAPNAKKREMKLSDMRYLLLERRMEAPQRDKPEENSVKDATCSIGGFTSFMVTYEDGLPVLYCYELHLAPELQHRGVGRQLMRMLEDIARNIGLDKTMLTVFKSNEAGVRFYERVGFTEDDYSPRPMKLRNGRTREFDYMILSKSSIDRNGCSLD